MSKAFFSESELKILGLARHFDFWIKLTSPNAYSSLQAGDSSLLPLYAHEWTHYIQLLTTALANLVAETERLLFFAKLQLVLFVSAASRGEISLPLEVMLKSSNELRNEPKVREAIQNVRDFAEAMQALCTPWGELLQDETFDLRILEQRPFRLDAGAGCLIYNSPQKGELRLPISATQLLEHSAKANELLLRGGLVNEDELVPSMFDYFGFFLYLVQEGKLRLITVGRGKFRIEIVPGENPQARTLGACVCMYACSQISQMLCGVPRLEGPIRPASDSGYTEFAVNRLRASTLVFCQMIEQFDLVVSILNRGDLEGRERLVLLCQKPSQLMSLVAGFCHAQPQCAGSGTV